MLRSLVFLLSSVADNLTAALLGKSSATVEAEYGDVVVPGSVLTLAHHGPRSANPAPCLYTSEAPLTLPQIDVVGLSHVDLDSLGGCMAILHSPAKSDIASDGVRVFWSVAAKVDVQGAHKLEAILADYQPELREECRQLLHAWWAWSEEHRCYAPRDGSVMDCTQWIGEAAKVIEALLLGIQPLQADLLAFGHAHRVREEELNKSSFRHWAGSSSCIVRCSESFCNHLYTAPNGEVGKAVVALNPKTGSVTVSLADPVPGISCRELVQELWGPLAGGHDGIAGSPRGETFGEQQLNAAAEAMASALNKAFPD